ncbi:PD-(D/E)XK motif protein [Subtercola boreus]|uniref:PD-(D/E)XK motif protein n=1 Tax=Subtercola boreus TaxID=120213 RepID=UPI001559B070|nr:PD-(D/E)XK motif protein [Subtercola boreus]
MIHGDVLRVFDLLEGRAHNASEGTESGYFVEIARADRPGIYLGVSQAGEKTFIVTSEQSQVPPPPLRLASIAVDYGIECQLREATSSRLVRVTVIRCLANEPGIIDVFTAMCAVLANSFNDRVTEREVAEELRRWSTLFWRLQERVETDVVGISGELVAIAASPNPDLWISAWHSRPNDLLDFIFDEAQVSVEVKATRSGKRRHTFSLDQIQTTGSLSRYVASVPVQFAESGESLADLIREISDRLNNDTSRLKLWEALSQVCGAGLEDVLARKFDVLAAKAGLAFFSADDIPSPVVERPFPTGVSRVSFHVDLDGVESFDSQYLDGLILV